LNPGQPGLVPERGKSCTRTLAMPYRCSTSSGSQFGDLAELRALPGRYKTGVEKEFGIFSTVPTCAYKPPDFVGLNRPLKRIVRDNL